MSSEIRPTSASLPAGSNAPFTGQPLVTGGSMSWAAAAGQQSESAGGVDTPSNLQAGNANESGSIIGGGFNGAGEGSSVLGGGAPATAEGGQWSDIPEFVRQFLPGGARTGKPAPSALEGAYTTAPDKGEGAAGQYRHLGWNQSSQLQVATPTQYQAPQVDTQATNCFPTSPSSIPADKPGDTWFGPPTKDGTMPPPPDGYSWPSGPPTGKGGTMPPPPDAGSWPGVPPQTGSTMPPPPDADAWLYGTPPSKGGTMPPPPDAEWWTSASPAAGEPPMKGYPKSDLPPKGDPPAKVDPPAKGEPAQKGDPSQKVERPTTSKDRGRYTVVKGDSLSKIAARHDVTWRQLFWENRSKIEHPDVIRPGQVLRIPQRDLKVPHFEYTPLHPSKGSKSTPTQAPDKGDAPAKGDAPDKGDAPAKGTAAKPRKPADPAPEPGPSHSRRPSGGRPPGTVPGDDAWLAEPPPIPGGQLPPDYFS